MKNLQVCKCFVLECFESVDHFTTLNRKNLYWYDTQFLPERNSYKFDRHTLIKPLTPGQHKLIKPLTLRDLPCSLWQDNLDSHTLHKLIIEDVIQIPHLEHVLVARVIQIFVRWEIVAHVIARLPASK